MIGCCRSAAAVSVVGTFWGEQQMRAAYYESVGPPPMSFGSANVPRRQPGPGEVRIRIHASGVNPSDVKARAGARGALAYPYVIPHSDGAGVIEAIGKRSGPMRESASAFGPGTRHGDGRSGPAPSLSVCPQSRRYRFPSNTDFDAGACLGIPAMTACHAALGDGPARRQDRIGDRRGRCGRSLRDSVRQMVGCAGDHDRERRGQSTHTPSRPVRITSSIIANRMSSRPSRS